MTNTPPNDAWTTHRTGHAAAASPPSPASAAPTLRKNAGDGASFKLTKIERANVEYVLKRYAEGYIDLEYAVNSIEFAINEGWKTCDCELTQPTSPVE